MAPITKERGRIRLEGAGGFLCPPGHPMHSASVETDLDKPRNYRGCMSLESAADCEWLDDATRTECKRKLAEWHQHKLPLTDPAVRAWVLQVLGYYRNLEAPQGEQWHAGKLVISTRSATHRPKPEEHAGVNLIRQYYPEYQPTADDFTQAKWGN